MDRKEEMRDECFGESRDEERKRVKERKSRDKRENKWGREVVGLGRRMKVGKKERERKYEQINANILTQILEGIERGSNPILGFKRAI